MLFKVRKSTAMYKLLQTAYTRFGFDGSHYKAWSEKSGVVNPSQTVGYYGLEDGDEVLLIPEQVGGKPIIYLYSPTAIDASVKLRLIPEWQFSAVYPVVPTKRDLGEQIEWNVSTHQDGSLTEKNTGLDVSYPFWEAE